MFKAVFQTSELIVCCSLVLLLTITGTVQENSVAVDRLLLRVLRPTLELSSETKATGALRTVHQPLKSACSCNPKSVGCLQTCRVDPIETESDHACALGSV